MKIDLRTVTIRDLVEEYVDDGDGGVKGYAGRLDIRPPYQREFVYKDAQQAAVINTVLNGFPLNVMYWSVTGKDRFEIIDGQQRTISLSRYVRGDFSFKERYFHSLQDDERERILDYELMIYVCDGTDSEKLKWYETINIAGEVLTKQELRNAVYAGPWLSDARRYFSRPGGAAYGLGSDYLTGAPIRQDYLETTLKWIAARHGQTIEEHMSAHQLDPNAKPLWVYFQDLIGWVEKTFPKRRKQMKGVDWGKLYIRFDRADFDPEVLEAEISRLFMDDDVTSKPGIYPYVLDRDERHLSIRAFTDAMKANAFERQCGVCPICAKVFTADQMEADHIDPWCEGGKTTQENCQMLCKPCNRRKGKA